MPELFGLALQRLDEVRVRMPEGVHGNPRRKVEIALAVFRHQPNALPSLEPQRHAIIGLEQRGFGHSDVAPSEKTTDIAGGRTENAEIDKAACRGKMWNEG